jgi:GDP-D-mannose dehydratase
MKAIIWGADGQDGFYLDVLLKPQDYEVIPVTKGDADISIKIIEAAKRIAEVAARS